MNIEDIGGNAEPMAADPVTQVPDNTAPPSIMDSIDSAFSMAEKETVTIDDIPVNDGQPRQPDGKFAQKEKVEEVAATTTETAPVVDLTKPVETAPTNDDPPARFSPDAKAAWKDAPAAIKGEVQRAIKELEGGINQYRAAMEPLVPYANMAEKSGQHLSQVLERYVNAENMLRTDPMRGMEHLLSNIGVTPQQYAEAVLNVPQEQRNSQSQQIIMELKQQIAGLQQQFGTVHQTIQQQQDQEAQRTWSDFAQRNPRAHELRETMHQLASSGMAMTLDEAYAKAERLNPAPQVTSSQPASAPAIAVSPSPAAQTRKAALSVTGAPAAGSNPSLRKPPTSPRDAIDQAFAATGLG